MPYDIYLLDESDITISGGGQLDGVTQGDGSHLNGRTITLNTNDWYAVAISDNDLNFDDNDGNQVLHGAQTIDGTTYANGTRVEAEYSLTLSDGTNTWVVVGFNVNNSSPAFGTIEGLAFIGGPGGFPPVGVPLSVIASAEGPNFPASSYATPICFVAGTLIDTIAGPMRVEDITVDDMVRTADDGYQPVRWHGVRRFSATGALAPVCFSPGAIGNDRLLRLSPMHRILVSGWQVQLFMGEDEVLAPAKAFVNGSTVRRQYGGLVEYHHLLFNRHQIIFAEGIPTESFFPGRTGMSSLEKAVQDELLTMFPELARNPSAYGTMARPSTRVRETRAIFYA